MSWRGQGITGSNNIPLGNKRRFGDDGDSGSATYDERAPSAAPSERELKRGRSPTRDDLPSGPKPRKRRNRWGDEGDNKVANLMNLATALTATMTSEQLDAYTVHLRIEEITQKLKIDDVVPADGDR